MCITKFGYGYNRVVYSHPHGFHAFSPRQVPITQVVRDFFIGNLLGCNPYKKPNPFPMKAFILCLILAVSTLSFKPTECNPPFLYMDGVWSTMAIANCYSVSEATSYTWRWRIIGSNKWSKVTTTYSVTYVYPLLPNTAYEIQVKPSCAPQFGQPIQFTTQ
jgi:hypothetical protein